MSKSHNVRTSRGHAIRADRTAQHTLFKTKLRSRTGAWHARLYRGANHSLDQDLEFVWGSDGRKSTKLSANQTLFLREEIAKSATYGEYFTVWHRSVRVMGDGRTYDYTIGIRAVTSIDGMTSDFFASHMGSAAKPSAPVSSTK